MVAEPGNRNQGRTIGRTSYPQLSGRAMETGVVYPQGLNTQEAKYISQYRNTHIHVYVYIHTNIHIYLIICI